MVAETVATETEMPTADDHERKKYPVREPTRAMGMKKTLENCVDISWLGRFIWWWVSQVLVFVHPFITRGKLFYNAHSPR